MKLVDIYMGTVLDSLPPPLPAPPGVTPPDIEIDFAGTGISPMAGIRAGFELQEIQSILGKYRGLKFRSVPVYVYVSGPDRIFENGNVTVSIGALNGDDHTAPLPGADLLSKQPVSPHELPVFPASGNTMTGTLSPKPETSFDLKDILNQDNPPGKLDFEYEINIGNITAKYDDLPVIREDFQKRPLSAVLVVVLPFQFSAGEDIPILSERNTDSESGAIHLLEEGEDLFGRSSADDEGEGSVKDVLERMQSLVIHVNIENNLGLAGYAPVYSARPNPGDPKENLLGRMNLSGPSSIAVSKSRAVYPFNIWVEIYLGEGQEFDIKRQAKDPSVPPLKLSLAVVVKTRIDETF
jgi:hypothetical protein